MTKKSGEVPPTRLADPSLWYWEKCACGAIMEFETKTAVVYDKLKGNWAKEHFGHTAPWINPNPSGPQPGSGITKAQRASVVASQPTDHRFQLMFEDLVKMRNNEVISLTEYDKRHGQLMTEYGKAKTK